jgi:hypothetical protein
MAGDAGVKASCWGDKKARLSGNTQMGPSLNFCFRVKDLVMELRCGWRRLLCYRNYDYQRQARTFSGLYHCADFEVGECVAEASPVSQCPIC